MTVLFPAGMVTGHLQSSAAARPSELVETGAREDDLSEMLADMPMSRRDLATPEHAVRNLLRDLDLDVPYAVTHGTVRSAYGLRREALEAALDRMEQS